MGFIDFLGDNLVQFWEYTGFANCTLPHLAMILVGLFFIYLAIKKNFEPMLLVVCSGSIRAIPPVRYFQAIGYTQNGISQGRSRSNDG